MIFHSILFKNFCKLSTNLTFLYLDSTSKTSGNLVLIVFSELQNRQWKQHKCKRKIWNFWIKMTTNKHITVMNLHLSKHTCSNDSSDKKIESLCCSASFVATTKPLVAHKFKKKTLSFLFCFITRSCKLWGPAKSFFDLLTLPLGD